MDAQSGNGEGAPNFWPGISTNMPSCLLFPVSGSGSYVNQRLVRRVLIPYGCHQCAGLEGTRRGLQCLADRSEGGRARVDPASARTRWLHSLSPPGVLG